MYHNDLKLRADDVSLPSRDSLLAEVEKTISVDQTFEALAADSRRKVSILKSRDWTEAFAEVASLPAIYSGRC